MCGVVYVAVAVLLLWRCVVCSAVYVAVAVVVRGLCPVTSCLLLASINMDAPPKPYVVIRMETVGL